MKRLLVLLFYVALTAACNPKIPNTILTYTRTDCNKLLSGRMEAVRCFPNCFMEKMGVFVNGEVQPQRMLEVMGPISGYEIVKTAQSHCDWIRSNTKCDTAWELNKCYFQLGVVIVNINPKTTLN